MMEFKSVIQNAPVFRGIAEDETESMLSCLGAKKKTYDKGQLLLKAGDKPDSVGLLLTGSALIIRDDFWGNRNIIGRVVPSGLFGEAFACSPGAVPDVAVMAEESSAVLWLSVNRILTVCPSACPCHSRVIRNILSELAAKNLMLNEKMTHMAQRTTREKVLSYLSARSQEQNSREFDISFNRQQLADYLSVERSALSAELSKLQSEGVIKFRKNHFKLSGR